MSISPGTEHDGQFCRHCAKVVVRCTKHTVNECYIHVLTNMHICSWTAGTDVAMPMQEAA